MLARIKYYLEKRTEGIYKKRQEACLNEKSRTPYGCLSCNQVQQQIAESGFFLYVTLADIIFWLDGVLLGVSVEV